MQDKGSSQQCQQRCNSAAACTAWVHWRNESCQLLSTLRDKKTESNVKRSGQKCSRRISVTGKETRNFTTTPTTKSSATTTTSNTTVAFRFVVHSNTTRSSMTTISVHTNSRITNTTTATHNPNNIILTSRYSSTSAADSNTTTNTTASKDATTIAAGTSETTYTMDTSLATTSSTGSSSNTSQSINMTTTSTKGECLYQNASYIVA